MRLPLIGLFCLAATLASAQTAEETAQAEALGITAPVGSQERSDQIAQAARDFASTFTAKLDAEPAADREAVMARLSDACVAMYRRDADATITNPVCLEIFLIDGLPD